MPSQINYTNVSHSCDPFLIPSVPPIPCSARYLHEVIWVTLYSPLIHIKGYLSRIPTHPTQCPNFGYVDNLLPTKMSNVNISMNVTSVSRHFVCILTGLKSHKPNSENCINFTFFNWLVRKILEGRDGRRA